jgi:hypothetical protein
VECTFDSRSIIATEIANSPYYEVYLFLRNLIRAKENLSIGEAGFRPSPEIKNYLQQVFETIRLP